MKIIQTSKVDNVKGLFTKSGLLYNVINYGKYNLFYVLIEKLLYLIIFLYLARTLSPEGYGFIVTVSVFSNIASSIFDFGFGFYTQRESAAQNSSINSIVNKAISARILLLFLYLIITFIYFGPALKNYIFIIGEIALINYIFSLNTIFVGVLYGRNKFKKVLYSLLKARSILIILVAVLFSFLSKLNSIFLPLLISTIIFTYLCLKETGIKFKFNFEFRQLSRLIKYSIPFGLGVLFVWIYDRSDIIFLQKIAGLKIVAFYSVAYSIYKIPAIFSSLILTVFYSRLSNMFSEKLKLNKDEIVKIAALLIIIALIFIVIMYFLGGFLLGLLYGKKYIQSWAYLKTLSFALPGLFLNNLTGITLNAIKKEKQQAWGTFSGLIINMILCPILIVFIGIWGAVITTIITEYLVFIVQFNFIRVNLKNGYI